MIDNHLHEQHRKATGARRLTAIGRASGYRPSTWLIDPSGAELLGGEGLQSQTAEAVVYVQRLRARRMELDRL